MGESSLPLRGGSPAEGFARGYQPGWSHTIFAGVACLCFAALVLILGWLTSTLVYAIVVTVVFLGFVGVALACARRVRIRLPPVPRRQSKFLRDVVIAEVIFWFAILVAIAVVWLVL